MHQPTPEQTGEVSLREVADADLPILFEQQLDLEANHMAAFTSKDPTDIDAFEAHWKWVRSDSTITLRTILLDGQVAGYISSFKWDGKREIGYWIGKEYWGKGIATRALSQFLDIVRTRPIYASAAADNIASLRVLQKCGFRLTGYGRGFSNARRAEIDEAMLELL